MQDQTEQLIELAGETLGYAREYIDNRIDYVKLDVSERSSIMASYAITIVICAFLMMIAMAMGLVALGLFLGSLFGNYALGFLAVMGICFLIILIVFILRKPLIMSPILSLLINKMYK